MLEGRTTAGVHHLSLRVHYEDTDFSGNVYHANYLKFCERGRSDFLRVLGIDQNAMIGGEAALLFVVRRMVCEFLKPAKFEDVLTVVTSPREMAGARLELSQRVQRGNELLFSAEVTVALIDGNGKPKRLPAEVAAKFRVVAR